MQRGMSRKGPRRPVWRVRGGVGTLGLAVAVYAADQVTAPPPPDDVAKTITAQRVKQGELANPPDLGNQRAKLTAGQMIEMAATYDAESKAAYEHAETTRIETYRSR